MSGEQRLSKRERQVVQLVTEGFSSKAIAGLLKLSVKTVDSHRASIMLKLDIHHVPGLVKYALKEGLTSLDQHHNFTES